MFHGRLYINFIVASLLVKLKISCPVHEKTILFVHSIDLFPGEEHIPPERMLSRTQIDSSSVAFVCPLKISPLFTVLSHNRQRERKKHLPLALISFFIKEEIKIPKKRLEFLKKRHFFLPLFLLIRFF